VRRRRRRVGAAHDVGEQQGQRAEGGEADEQPGNEGDSDRELGQGPGDRFPYRQPGVSAAWHHKVIPVKNRRAEKRMAQPQEDDAVRALYAPLLGRLRTGLPVRQELSALVDDAVKVWSRPGFETFLSQAGLRFVPFDYQVQAARTALRRMRGRAILADEVGLGKTIEAGLVLAELRLRGLADRTLVITPAGLVTQWQEELERKFAVPTATAAAAAQGDDRERPVIIASLAAARRDPLKSQLAAGQWDLLIVDEAHRVRSPRSASGKLVRELRARHLLLLTATPVENRLQACTR
jgi:SNF2 family DNA or RNA helicase